MDGNGGAQDVLGKKKSLGLGNNMRRETRELWMSHRSLAWVIRRVQRPFVDYRKNEREKEFELEMK